MFLMRTWILYLSGSNLSDAIEVEVYLHTTLVQFSPDGKTRRFLFNLPEESTIGDLVKRLKISHPAAGLLFGLNGQVADEETRLSPGDKVHVMMPISGG